MLRYSTSGRAGGGLHLKLTSPQTSRSSPPSPQAALVPSAVFFRPHALEGVGGGWHWLRLPWGWTRIKRQPEILEYSLGPVEDLALTHAESAILLEHSCLVTALLWSLTDCEEQKDS